MMMKIPGHNTLKWQVRMLTVLINILCMSMGVSSDDLHVHANVTSILDSLLDNYDSSLYPTYGEGPTPIYVSLMIRSMGPISEVDMSFSMDAYFRQRWRDKRLQYRGPVTILKVDNKLLESIWKPDTYFFNGKESYHHHITTPNRLIRIRQDGTILFSTRLTIRAKCPMDLQSFPLDLQRCPLQFGSFGYTTDQVVYKWQYAFSSIKTARDLQLSQYTLGKIEMSKLDVKRTTGEFSSLKVIFPLRRHAGHFIIQIYFPCIMIVILSWINFWIQREATADRIGLGVTTVLTLTTLRLDTSTPKVPYATALDLYVILCFIYAIATVLEFWGVHYFTKKDSGEIEHDSGDEEECADEYDDSWYMKEASNYGSSNSYSWTNGRKWKKQPTDARFHLKLLYCILGSNHYKKQQMQRTHSVNSISKIDQVSRIAFPLSFIVINVLYFWYFRIWNLVSV